MMPGRALGIALGLFAVAGDSTATETGFYAGADMAWVAPTVHKSDGINFLTPDGVAFLAPDAVHFDDSSLGWGAMIGYRFNRHLAAELAYAEYGSIGVQEVFRFPSPAPGLPSRRVDREFDARLSGPMVSVVGLLPVSAGIEAFGRAGVLWARQELQLSPQFSFNDAEEQWVLGIGVQAELSRSWSARLEYQRIDEIRGTAISGEIDYDRLLAGATYRLGSRKASASDREALVEKGERGFYAVADFGVSEPVVGRSDGLLISIPFFGSLFQVTPNSASTPGANPGFGASLGFRINRYLAAELAYTDFGSIDVAEQYSIGLPASFPPRVLFEETVKLTARVSGPSVNVLGKLPVGDYFELFLRGGLLFADEDVTQRFRGFTSSGANAEELWVIGGGVDVRLADRWSARFAYESVERLRKIEFVGPIRLERFVFGVSYDF